MQPTKTIATDDDDGLWDYERTAKFLDVSTRTVFTLATEASEGQEPELRALKIRGKVKFRPADVRAYVDRQAEKGLRG